MSGVYNGDPKIRDNKYGGRFGAWAVRRTTEGVVWLGVASGYFSEDL
jgi:hypothetical protein